MDPILDSLNPQQQDAVLQKDGPILIIAGAGSGKTRVLTSKIALLLRDGVEPWRIMALTFTRKAAGEIKDRVQAMTGLSATDIAMGTFHSVFARFLREYHDFIGMPPNFTIYDEDASDSCLAACIADTVLGPDWNDKEKTKTLTDEQKEERKRLLSKYKVKDVKGRISLAKNDYVLPEDYAADERRRAADLKAGRPAMATIYSLYVSRCRLACAMDFDDILVYMHMLLCEHPTVLRELSERFRYILVDEYQDTNTVQYMTIRRLCAVHGNVCVVGDDSQSIYAFRGARIENILSFQRDFPDVKTYKLTVNYRSSSNIVDAANHLIENNSARLPKTCTANKGEGVPILVQKCRDDRDEANYITASIRNHRKLGDSYASQAVLYRTNAQSRALEDALVRARIPYVIWSGTSFYDRQEVKDVLAYMRLCVNPNDDEAFKRICNRPARKISDATLSALCAEASFLQRPLMYHLQEIDSSMTSIKKKPLEALTAFRDLILGLGQKTAGMLADDATALILQESGIMDFYRNEKGEDGQKRSHNIDELLNGVRYFVSDQIQEKGGEQGAATSLQDYIDNIALLSNTDTDEQDGDHVCLMTSHCSKGLEFPTVYVAGVEEGLYPLLHEGDGQDQLEEERRLFYVSITRAMRELVLTHCERRWQYGNVNECTESRFLGEMALEDMDDLPV